MKVALLLLCFFANAGLGLWSMTVHMRMVEKVNRSLPENEQFRMFGWHVYNFSRMINLHEKLFPASSDRKKLGTAFLGMVASVLCVFVVIMFS